MPSIKLNMRVQRQQHTEWCWAAVATSVELFFDPRSTLCQCRLATRMAKIRKLGVTCGSCPNTRGIPEKCNQPWFPEKALRIMGRLKGRPKRNFVSFGEIEKNIEAGRPVCARIQWGRGPDAHVVAITGCATGRSGERWIDIEDPFAGSSTWRYEEFRANYLYCQGHWDETYFTK